MESSSLKMWVLLFFVCAGACKAQGVDAIPTPAAAYEIERSNVAGNSEVFFKLDEDYPSTGVLSFYGQYLSRNGWEKCVGGIESWQSFIDRTNAEAPHVVHQIAHYWINRSVAAITTVSLSYRSERSQKSDLPPDNRTQIIVVLMRSPRDISEEIDWLSLRCP